VTQPSILIVDDDATTRKIVSRVLQREGYAVLVARNSSEAFSSIREHHPDLVILDVVLPGMDGYEICHHLRTEESLAGLSILMFTARNLPADQRRGFSVGADDYLTKPINSADLVSRIRSMLFFKVSQSHNTLTG
jgi:DNA-binding response OmpR family regulator